MAEKKEFMDLLQETSAAERERRQTLEATALELRRFGDGLVYSPEALSAVEKQLTTLAGMDARMKWEIGRRLVWVQGHTDFLPGKNFTLWLQEKTPFARRTAQHYMAVARRLAALPESELADMPAAKAYALLELTDEQIAEYAETGCIGDKQPDEVDLMSPEDLRDLCRRQAGKLERGRQQLEDLRDRNEQLEREAGRRARAIEATFAARIEGTIVSVEQFLETVKGAETAEALSARVGDEEVARRMLLRLQVLMDQLGRYTRLLQPKGKRVQVRGAKGGVATSKS